MIAGIENTWTCSPCVQFMGIHTKETFTDKPYRVFINLTNFASWMILTPILGRIAGLAMLYHVIVDLKNGDSIEDSEGRIAYSLLFARSIVQIAGFGALFILPDLIITIGRQLSIYQCRRCEQ